MILLALTLSIIYLIIRYKFTNAITFKESKQEFKLLLISNILLLISAIIYSIIPNIFNLILSIFYLSLAILELPKIWSPHLLKRILIIVLGVLLFIPYVNIISLFIISTYLLITSIKKRELLENIGLLILSLATLIAVISKWNIVVWYAAAFYYIIRHLGHTTQLLDMLQNAGKNVVTDTLTGLYNRRWLYKRLEQLVTRQEVGVIFCDIDNFKKLNDEQGHDYGDFVLQKSGEIIRKILKGNGYGCRYGGEELIGLVHNPGRTVGLAEQILEAVRKELKITMSIGVAIGNNPAEELLKIADERMYISKTTGKNKITFETEKKEEYNEINNTQTK